MFNVYLDDVRPGPFNGETADYRELVDNDLGNRAWHTWVICRSVDQVKELLLAGLVRDLSLDHDLGEGRPTGYDLCCWMEETITWPVGKITIHSANPVGAERMRQIVKKHNEYVEG